MANTVKLQGIAGTFNGVPAKEIKIGDVLVWNYGYKSEVTEIIPSKSGKTMTFMVRSLTDGVVRPRKTGADTLYVVEPKKGDVVEDNLHAVEKAILKEINDNTNQTLSCCNLISIALDNFSTDELIDYIKSLNLESSLRYYLETQITAHIINQAKWRESK